MHASTRFFIVVSSFLVNLLLMPTTALAVAQERDEKAEREAEQELERARRRVGKGQMKSAWKGLMKLEEEFHSTHAVRAAREEIARLRLEAGVEVVGAAAGLHGVLEVDRSQRLVLRYDFAREDSFQDFQALEYLPDTAHLSAREGVLRGTGAFCHRALFTGDVTVTIEGLALDARDVGVACIDPRESSRFAVGIFGNTFFGVKYDADRKITPGHVLLFGGRGAVSRAKENPTQLLASSERHPLAADEAFRGTFTWKDAELSLRRQDPPLHLKATLLPEEQAMPIKRVGIHLKRSAFRPTFLVIEGKLDPEWSERELERLRAELAK